MFPHINFPVFIAHLSGFITFIMPLGFLSVSFPVSPVRGLRFLELIFCCGSVIVIPLYLIRWSVSPSTFSPSPSPHPFPLCACSLTLYLPCPPGALCFTPFHFCFFPLSFTCGLRQGIHVRLGHLIPLAFTTSALRLQHLEALLPFLYFYSSSLVLLCLVSQRQNFRPCSREAPCFNAQLQRSLHTVTY